MRTLTILAFSLVLFSNISAQRGLEAGALIQPQVYSHIYTEGEPDRAVKIPYSFAIGANLSYNFSDYFGLRTGFLYSPLGEKYNDISSDPEVAVEVNLEYLQVPLYLKLNGSPENRFSFLLLAGPHVSFLNNATITLDEDDPIGVLNDYQRFVVGGAVAVGIQINLSRGGNLNFLWYNSASIQSTNKAATIGSHYVSSGLQLAYHYFIIQ